MSSNTIIKQIGILKTFEELLKSTAASFRAVLLCFNQRSDETLLFINSIYMPLLCSKDSIKLKQVIVLCGSPYSKKAGKIKTAQNWEWHRQYFCTKNEELCVRLTCYNTKIYIFIIWSHPSCCHLFWFVSNLKFLLTKDSKHFRGVLAFDSRWTFSHTKSVLCLECLGIA